MGRRFIARTMYSHVMSRLGEWNFASRLGRTLSINMAESFRLGMFFMATGMEVPRRVQPQSNALISAMKKIMEPTVGVCCYCEEMTTSAGAITIASWNKGIFMRKRQRLEHVLHREQKREAHP